MTKEDMLLDMLAGWNEFLEERPTNKRYPKEYKEKVFALYQDAGKKLNEGYSAELFLNSELDDFFYFIDKERATPDIDSIIGLFNEG